ncbi:MAG: OsmC family protein, partial [Anaerolineales bacterium]
LVTCAGIFVLGFCRQRDIPTDDIRLIQSHEVDRSTGMVKRIEVTIELPPDFPEQYKDAVVRSAEICSVKKHLASPPEIDVITT